jgi:hypothetical protein
MKMKLPIARAIPVLALALSFQTVQLPAETSKAAAGEKTFTGTISDAMCGATHMAKDKSAAECTRMCVKQGQKYALVVGSKVYTLEGHESDLDKLAGEKATVKGKLSGDTLTVNSVTQANKKGTS